MFVFKVEPYGLLYVLVHTPLYAHVRHLCGHTQLSRIVQSSISNPSRANRLADPEALPI
jgi:hypothetical protein